MSHVRVGGTWREFDKVWVKIGGTWREVDKIFTKISGAWREGWASSENFIVFYEGNVLKKYSLDGTFIASRTFNLTGTVGALAIGPDYKIYTANKTSNTNYNILTLDPNSLATIQTSSDITINPSTTASAYNIHIGVNNTGEVITSIKHRSRHITKLNHDGTLMYSKILGIDIRPSSTSLITNDGDVYVSTYDSTYDGTGANENMIKYDSSGTQIYNVNNWDYSTSYLLMTSSGLLYGVSGDVTSVNTETGRNSRIYRHTSTGTYGSFRGYPSVDINGYLYIGTGRGNDRNGGRIFVYAGSGSFGGVVHPGENTDIVDVDNNGYVYSYGADLTIRKSLASNRTLVWSLPVTETVYSMAVTPGAVHAFYDKY